MLRVHIAPFYPDGAVPAPDSRAPALPGYDHWRPGDVDWQKANRRLTFRVVAGAIACWSAIGLFVWWLFQ